VPTKYDQDPDLHLFGSLAPDPHWNQCGFTTLATQLVIHDQANFNARSFVTKELLFVKPTRHQVRPKFNRMQVRILELSVASNARS
jgi:hypothetical protein